MKKPIKRSLNQVPLEDTHGGSGQKQLIFSSTDNISQQFEAWTKGYLPSHASYDWHHHVDIAELFIVLSGSGIIEYEDGTKYKYVKDDVFFNPENLPHKITDQSVAGSTFYFIRVNK